MYCAAYWFVGQELQTCLYRTPLQHCEERNGCNNLQTLIWATQEHCCCPWLYIQLSPWILTVAAQNVLGSYSLVELILCNRHYHAIRRCADITLMLEYLYTAIPMHDVLLHHFGELLLLVIIHSCILSYVSTFGIMQALLFGDDAWCRINWRLCTYMKIMDVGILICNYTMDWRVEI